MTSCFPCLAWRFSLFIYPSIMIFLSSVSWFISMFDDAVTGAQLGILSPQDYLLETNSTFIYLTYAREEMPIFFKSVVHDNFYGRPIRMLHTYSSN